MARVAVKSGLIGAGGVGVPNRKDLQRRRFNLDFGAQFIQRQPLHQSVHNAGVALQQIGFVLCVNQEIKGQLALRCQQGSHMASAWGTMIDILGDEVLQEIGACFSADADHRAIVQTGMA